MNWPDRGQTRIHHYGIGTAAMLALCVLVGACSATDQRPNIVLISIDTLRADHLGAYGYPKATSPWLDQLASGGVTFLNAYAHSSYTPPSQTSLLTSVHPSVHGVWLHNMAASSEVPMLAEILQQAGYDTGAMTELTATHYKRGFDTYQQLQPLRNRGNARKNRRRITRWLDAREDRPYFLFLHFFSVHLPYAPQDEHLIKFVSDYDGVLGNSVTVKEVRSIRDGRLQIGSEDWDHLRALYDAEIAFLDEFLGELFGQSHMDNSSDATVFAIVSDHGEEFGEHGSLGHAGGLWEYILRTPLILSGPGIPSGAVIQAPARNIDVAPTLLRLAGLDVPAHYEGADLAPIWLGEERRNRVVIAEKRCCRSLISAGWKYGVILETGVETLFDLAADPDEKMNLVDEMPEVAKRMRDLATKWEAQLAKRRSEIKQGVEVTLSEDEIRRLKALGYLQ